MWSLAGSQAVDQQISCFGPESRGWPAALGLGRTASRSAALALCVEQVASAPGVNPPEVSGVGGQLGFQLWAPSPPIWVRAARIQVNAGVGYPVFKV